MKIRGRTARSVLLLLALALLAWECLRAARTAPDTDFVEYWAASRLFLSGGNPYSPAQMLHVQQTVNSLRSEPLLLWNPPWILPLLTPLGACSYRVAWLFWLLAGLLVVFFSADWAWRYYGGRRQRRWISWLLAATYVPGLVALGLGQLGPFLLLGIIGFLHFQDRQPLLAGLSALLISLKPQLLYLFWIALLLWVASDVCSRWRVLAGAALGWLLASGIVLARDPAIFLKYINLVQTVSVLRNPSPSAGTALRMIFGPQHAWLQFLPCMAGLIWFATNWRPRWNWNSTVRSTIVVSLLTTSYGWLFDQVVLIPQLVERAALLDSRDEHWPRGMLLGYAAINLATLGCMAAGVTGIGYIWILPAWVALYRWPARRQEHFSTAA